MLKLKMICLALGLGLASLACAHDLSALSHAANPALESFLRYANTHSKASSRATTAYQIDKISPKKAGEKIDATIERVVSFSLHRDYPITGDDGGYSFSYLTKSSSAGEVDNALDDLSDIFDGSSEATQLRHLVNSALKANLLVLVGTGSGNNTEAQILVIADRANLQFVTFIDSNFGSDD